MWTYQHQLEVAIEAGVPALEELKQRCPAAFSWSEYDRGTKDLTALDVTIVEANAAPDVFIWMLQNALPASLQQITHAFQLVVSRRFPLAVHMAATLPLTDAEAAAVNGTMDVEAVPPDKEWLVPPVFYAVAMNSISALRALVAADATCVYRPHREKSGFTPAHSAAAHGHLEVLQWLVEFNPIVLDLQDNVRYTPLMWAVYFGHIPIVRWMIQRHPNTLNHEGAHHFYPLLLAVYNGHLDLAQILLEADHTVPDMAEGPWIVAAHRGHIHLLEWLIDVRLATPDDASKGGLSGLHVAARAGRLATVKWFVRMGYPRHYARPAKHLPTPLRCAVQTGCVATAQWLVRSGHGDPIKVPECEGGVVLAPVLRPWCPEHHAWFPPLFRGAVRAWLLCNARGWVVPAFPLLCQIGAYLWIQDFPEVYPAEW